MKKWNHPELGEFKHRSYRWEGMVHLPSFQKFRYRWSGRKRGTADIPLYFEEENEEDPEPPSDQAVSIAKQVVRNEAELAKSIQTAVWNDLNGIGRKSGIWWHGEVQRCREEPDRSGAWADAFRKLQKPDNLFDVIGGVEVKIRKKVYRYEQPCAVIEFQPAFETEHGLGVLTDGQSVLGVGYQYDVSPYFD